MEGWRRGLAAHLVAASSAVGSLAAQEAAPPLAGELGAETVLSTVAASIGLESASGRLARRLGTAHRGWARLRAAALGLGARLLAMILAWGTGYALATLAFAENGRPDLAQTLYLNAFAAFALARLGLRALASPDAAREPSLSALAPAAQRAVFLWLAAVAGVAIQGFMFVVPLAHHWAGFAGVRPARTLTATLAALLALLAVRAVARTLDAHRPPRGGDAAAAAAVAAGASGAWRRAWPVLAVAYVLVVWLVVVTRPALAEGVVVGGTLASGGALLLLLGALRLLRGAPRARALPGGRLRDSVPHLAPRADRLVALLAWGLAGALLLAAPLLAAAGWGWLDAGGLLGRPGVRAALGRAGTALLVLVAAAALWAAVASWIDARLAVDGGPGRRRTLLALFRNAFTVALAVLAGMVALSQVGLDIAPLLAGAGVVGLAIGFGAQTLVKDIITGVFIQLEGALDVGDVVGVAGVTGGVERVTIRSVRLRTLDGSTHVIPFSSVTTVQNLTRDFAFHVAELLLAHDQDVGAARAALQDAFDALMADPLAADVLEPLEPPAVVALREDALTLRTRIKTRPGRQWDVGNRYAELLAAALAARGVGLAVPTRTILMPGPARAAEA